MRKVAKYQAIAAEYRQKIHGGELQPGDMLPSLNEGMEKYGVTKVTVIAAYKVLKGEGLIESHAGQGTRVFDPNRPIDIPVPADLVAQIDVRARREGMRRSEWIKSALVEMLDSHS
jgi:DNA-binding GntR family transcriptional regulator